ncbi:MAG: two-component system regulatory protein YycI [Enterococcus lacertideformus]|uniref:Two-component system regulatory protein YycI n=1 Tax=Enterococcus lacertideformus TaxID=2771493 RepID=A0A931FBF4_9ENTE|nr:two-component system regulatory protein YycI [Enterococcus lacertideformus]
MDFKKIEWIFFVAFLGINVFLFSSYQEAISQESNVIRSGQTESIQQRLASDDISYTGKISSESRQGYYLSAEETSFSKKLAEQHNDSEKKSLLTSDIVINENVLFGSNYVYAKNFSNLDSSTPEIQASQIYEGLPFYDDTAKIVFSLTKKDKEFMVTKYTQTHLSDIEQLREKMELHTEEDAIKTLYANNKISRGSKILWRQLAYSCILKVREKNVYVPIWYIAIESTDKAIQVESVNAFSNTIVTNNTIPKVEDH